MIAHGGRVPDGYDENEDVDVVRRASHSYANVGNGMNYFGGLWSYADDELNSAPLSNSTTYSSLDSTHGDIAMVFAVAGLHAVADTPKSCPRAAPNLPLIQDFAVLCSVWIVFILVLITHGATGIFHERAVEDRRVKEINELVVDSARPYTDQSTPSPSATSTEGAAATTSPSTEGTNEAAVRVERDEVETECALCLEDYEIGVEVSKLPCGHMFHSECIRKWLLSTPFRARSCPKCRQTPLVSDLEFEEIENERERERAEQMAHTHPASIGSMQQQQQRHFGWFASHMDEAAVAFQNSYGGPAWTAVDMNYQAPYRPRHPLGLYTGAPRFQQHGFFDML